MRCPTCQFENPQHVKYCVHCGNKFESICPTCGARNSPSFNFCGQCGISLSRFPEPVASQEKDHDAALSHSLPEARIPSDTLAEGERKHVTVLFSDLTGYTAISENLDPEEVREITRRIFDQISKIIHKYDGFIEKYAGDAVMALFGASQAQEDDPVRAVKSAKEIHEWVQTLSPEVEETIGQPLSMHTGINTGLVVTGEVDLDQGTHGVAGSTINIASRLSATAQAGDILVDHETFTRSEGYFHFEDLGPIQVKGKSKAIQVHKVIYALEQPRKIHRLHGLRAELIGRKVEMAQLSEALEDLRQGKGRVVSIIGTAGTGKSRLVEEFKAALDLKMVQWREGQAFPYAQNIPYFPLIDLISKTIHIDEGDAPETVKEKLESSLEVLIGEHQGIAPYLGSLYALDYPEIKEVSPEFWKTELQKAILSVLTALARRGPTVVCLEDLHWADPSTLGLVHYLLSEIRQPVLFLCVYRPTVSPLSTHKIKAMALPHQELHLRDLSLSEAQMMVESLLKTETIPVDLQRFIRNKVEGNPFYLEEVVNSLIDSDVLVNENDTWKITRSISGDDISATIQGVISARVDRLEKESRRILQEASVIGRSFYYEIIKRVTAFRDNIDRCLTGLERLELIKTKSIKPDLEYIFKHALTQEVVYNGLLKKERREIHERIGLVIEYLFKDRLPEFVETLAFHFARGLDHRKAIDYLRQSGEKCLRRYAVEESHRHYQKAYELLINNTPKSPEDDLLLVDLLNEWAYVFYYRGDFKGQSDILTVHEALGKSVRDPSKSGMFYGWLGWNHFFRNRPEASYQYLQRALKLGEMAKDPVVIGYACAWLTWTCTNCGRLDEALTYGERAKEISRTVMKDQYLYFKSIAGVGYCSWFRGDRSQARAAGRALVEYGHRHANIRSITMGHWVSGFYGFIDGDFASAAADCEKAIQVSADPFYTMTAKLALGFCHFFNNKIDQAELLFREISDYSCRYGCEIYEMNAQGMLGVIAIIRGDMRRGMRRLEEARQTMKISGNRPGHALLEFVCAKTYLSIVEGSGPKQLATLARNLGFILKNIPVAFRKAETHFKRTITISEEIGARWILSRAYLDLGRLYRIKRQNEKAVDNLSKAIRQFEACGGEASIQEAKAELAAC